MTLVSACLCGLKTRYDGEILKGYTSKMKKINGIVPVCPEQLGGLPTPRAAIKIVNGTGDDVILGKARLLNTNGEDVTSNVLTGVREVMKIVKLLKIKKAILKSNSPCCGVNGVLTAFLKKSKIKVNFL